MRKVAAAAAAMAAVLLPMIGTAQVRIEKTAYKGWPNCYRITNGEVDLIVTSDIGPRVMRYGFVGGQNLFWEQPEGLGKSGEPAWVLRGGHRIWVGPEDIKYTYPPDNVPVRAEIKGSDLIVTQPVEKETGIEKQIQVQLEPKGSAVTVIHRLTNRGNMPLEYAAWALTMMAQNGVGITGFPPRGTHPEVLQPTNPLVMWAFTDLTDKRWQFTKKYMMLRQDPANSVPQKLGIFNENTWGAYALNGELFIKRTKGEKDKPYPDLGCSFETFTNNLFLELETLGPITKVPAGGTLEHVERWSLHKGVKIGAWTDAELDRAILPLLAGRPGQ